MLLNVLERFHNYVQVVWMCM